MSIDSEDLKSMVVTPVLRHLGIWSPVRVALTLGTAAQESLMGKYLKQISGPALGIYQCEPATHRDIWDNFLRYRPEMAEKCRDLSYKAATWARKDEQLATNLAYATAICAMHYLRVPEYLPASKDVKKLASYWKRYYNTSLGKGTEEEFIENYRRYVEE